MIKVGRGKKAKNRAQGLVLGKTTVIVNRKTAVFVARDQGWTPAQTIIVPTMKFEAYYRYVPDLTRILSILQRK